MSGVSVILFPLPLAGDGRGEGLFPRPNIFAIPAQAEIHEHRRVGVAAA